MIAAACVALASCVKNEVEPFVNESPISFQAVQGLQHTRATYDTAVPFAASAFLLDVSESETWATNGHTVAVEPYFLLQEVTYGTPLTGKWTTADPYYWPIQDKLVFFAHSPATVAALIDATSKAYTFADYDVDAVKNQDFMVATVVAAGYDKTTNEVPVAFKHRLTKISFKVTTTDYPANKTIAVNKIVITGLANKGTLVLDKVGTPVTPDPAEANWTAEIGWKGQTQPLTPVSYVYFEGSQAISGETAIPATEDDPATTGVDESAQTIFLPQSFVGNDNAKVIVDYTITTDLGGSLKATEEVTGIEVKLNAGTPTAWEMNKHITYVISVAPGKRILWAQPTINNWTEETGSLAI